MARQQWQQISAQGLNPLGAMGQSISALQGAAATAQGLRTNERANEAAIMSGYNDLIKSTRSAGTAAAKAESDAAKAAVGPYDSVLGENLMFDHFEQGGTTDNISQNPTLHGFIQQYGDDAWQQVVASKGRWDKEVETETTRLNSMLSAEHAQAIAEIDRRSDSEAVKNQLKADLEDQLYTRQAGIHEHAINNMSSRRSFNRFSLGNTPGTNVGQPQREATDTVITALGGEESPVSSTGSGGSSSPMPSKSNVFKDFMSELHTNDQIQREQLQNDLDNGIITPEAHQEQLEIINDDFNKSLADMDTQQKRYSIVDASGESFRFNYMIEDDGVVKVDGKNLSPEVSNALTEASEAFDVPMDIALAVTKAESSFKSGAVSPSNVVGLMQVTTGTTKDMMRQYGEIFGEKNLTDPSDRANPRVSALTGVGYLAHIRDNFLGGGAPIDQLYVAYNIGPSNPLVNQFHIKNIPIDKIQGVNTNLDSFQNNKGLYYNNKEDRWRTVAEVSSEIKSRMGLESESDNSGVIDQLSQAANVSQDAATRWENDNAPNSTLGESLPIDRAANALEPGTNPNLNLFVNPDAGLSYASEIYSSVLAAPAVQVTGSVGGEGGTSGKLGAAQLKDMLEVTGIKTTPANLGKVHDAINKNPTARMLPAEDLAVVLSYAPPAMWSWGKGMDVPAFEANLESLMSSWESNKGEIRKQMTHATNLKRDTERFKQIYTEARDNIQALEEDQYKYQDMDPETMNDTDVRAMAAAASQRIDAENNLKTMTLRYQSRMQDSIGDILRIRKAITDEFALRASRQAEEDLRNTKEGIKNANASSSGSIFPESTSRDPKPLDFMELVNMGGIY